MTPSVPLQPSAVQCIYLATGGGNLPRKSPVCCRQAALKTGLPYFLSADFQRNRNLLQLSPSPIQLVFLSTSSFCVSTVNKHADFPPHVFFCSARHPDANRLCSLCYCVKQNWNRGVVHITRYIVPFWFFFAQFTYSPVHMDLCLSRVWPRPFCQTTGAHTLMCFCASHLQHQ